MSKTTKALNVFFKKNKSNNTEKIQKTTLCDHSHVAIEVLMHAA